MKWIRVCLDLLFPRRCTGCRALGDFLCTACLNSIPVHSTPMMREPEWILDGLFVVASYEKGSLLQTAIKTMKYRHAPALADRLGEWMGHRVPLERFRTFQLVAVPLHVKRERERGYNQARLLAAGVASVLMLPMTEPLQRHRYTSPQAQLSREKRLKNLENSFSIRGSPVLLNKKFILVDDVCSTGATMNECARVLRAVGAISVYGLVLARGG